ncbi:MAG TPA: hypothetical protein VII02_12500 [Gemmatimonadaceae bacterium]
MLADDPRQRLDEPSLSTATTTRRPSVSATGAALSVLIASIYLLTAAGRFANFDAESMFAVTRSLYSHGRLDVEGCTPAAQSPGHPAMKSDPALMPRSLQCVPGVDGRYYSAYGVVTSIAALPFFAAGRLTGQSLGFDPDLVAAAFVSFMNSLVGALACVLFFLWAVRAGCSLRESALAAILLAFATPFWFHSTKELYSEPLFALFLVGSFAALRRASSRSSAAAAGLLFGLAVGTRVFGLIYLPILAPYAYLVSTPAALGATSGDSLRHWRVARTSSFLMAVLVCLVALGGLNLSRFGSPLNTGYHTAGSTAGSLFTTPSVLGLRRILFDGEVGLAWFSPLIFLLPVTWPRFHRQHRLESLACLGVAGSSLVFFAGYTSWHGGWSYGPRLLTPILPFLILPLVPLLSKAGNLRAPGRTLARVAGLVILIAVTVQVIGIVPPYSRHYYLKSVYQLNPEYSWLERSALLDNVVALPKVLSYAARARRVRGDVLLPGSIRQGIGATADSARVTGPDRHLLTFPNSVNQFAPDIWWIKAGVLGVTWRLLAPLVLVLCACAVAAGIRVRKMDRSVG